MGGRKWMAAARALAAKELGVDVRASGWAPGPRCSGQGQPTDDPGRFGAGH